MGAWKKAVGGGRRGTNCIVWGGEGRRWCMSVAELPTYRPLSLSLHYRNEHHCWLDGKGRGNGRRPAVYILSISLLRGRTNPLQLQPPRSVLWIDLSVRPPALSSSSPSLDCGRKMTSPLPLLTPFLRSLLLWPFRPMAEARDDNYDDRDRVFHRRGWVIFPHPTRGRRFLVSH